jgi:uncharacterized protein YbbK (DUF523 family)
VILISACLVGINCKYCGGNNYVREAAEIASRGGAIPVCPEQLGGCTTPRPAAEIKGGTGADVLDGKCSIIRKDGEDITEKFIKGAEEVLKIALLTGAKKAILKAMSPSCGCGRIYDGTFSRRLTQGNGVTAELLLRNGIEVITEEELS